MNIFKFIWGKFFRLFPCPTPVRLLRIGNPGRESPVLLTCNFYITVRRLLRRLRGLDVWLLVADSKGVNVWCAAVGNEFNVQSVVSAVKTSGIVDLVNHRTIILPPLAAPGINAKEIKDKTGWTVRWGPIRAEDIPRYLENGKQRSEEMKRVTYNWIERLDAALGSVFPFFFLGAFGFFVFGRHLILDYVVIGIVTFLFFMLACPWLPGKRGVTKAIFLDILLGALLIIYKVLDIHIPLSIHADLIIAMVMFLLYGTELGGISSNLRSDLDPLLARLGVGAIGNITFAGTVRAELLTGARVLTLYRDNCIGCRNCTEVCPQGVWNIDEEKRAVLAHSEKCTACKACLVQCEGNAIKAKTRKVDKNPK